MGDNINDDENAALVLHNTLSGDQIFELERLRLARDVEIRKLARDVEIRKLARDVEIRKLDVDVEKINALANLTPDQLNAYIQMQGGN